MKKTSIILFTTFAMSVITHTLFAAESTFSVEQMDCITCPVVVKAALEKLEGVESSTVSMVHGEAIVKYDEKLLSTDQIAKTIRESGFPAKLKQ